MSASKKSLLLLAFPFLSALLLNSVYAQGISNANAHKLQVGYVVVTPTPVLPSTNTSGLAVFETFGEMRFGGALQAGVLPPDLATSAMLFVTTSSRLSRNLGVAIANPQSSDAHLTFALHNSGGIGVATKQLTVTAHNQSAQFVTQLFAGQLPAPGEFDGTLFVTSDVPVAMVGLRFRGMNFSTIPVTVLAGASSFPIISTGIGGAGALILPQFADGGGWASEIVLGNTGTLSLTVRVDVFNQDGSPMTVTLNGMTASSFPNLAIAPGGVMVLAPRIHAADDDGF